MIGTGAAVLAMAVALVGAGAFAAVTGWVAWRAAMTPWPTVDQATALAKPVLPAGKPKEVTEMKTILGGVFDESEATLIMVIGNPEPELGGVTISYIQPRAVDWKTAYSQALSRLTADGWRAEMTGEGMFDYLVAERDGIRLTMSLEGGYEETTEELILSVSPAPPTVAFVVAGIGAAFGGLFGWLAAAAAMARGRRGTPARQAGAILLGSLGVVASLPATVFNLMALVAVAFGYQYGSPPWPGYEFALARPGAVVGAALLVTAYVMSATGAAHQARKTVSAVGHDW